MVIRRRAWPHPYSELTRWRQYGRRRIVRFYNVEFYGVFASLFEIPSWDQNIASFHLHLRFRGHCNGFTLTGSVNIEVAQFLVKHVYCQPPFILEPVQKIRIYWYHSDALRSYRLYSFTVKTIACSISSSVQYGSHPCNTSFFLQHRRRNHDRDSEWFRNDVWHWECPSPTTSRHKHVNTAMQPIQDVPCCCHIDISPASLLFNISEPDCRWILRAPYADCKYPLTFSAVFASIHRISLMLIQM